jgi:hypothetical protein
VVLLARQLLSDVENRELDEMIFEVEKLVLETELVPEEVVDPETGKVRVLWVEKVIGRHSLYDIEMACESNPDYYSYFEKSDGMQVTKFDVERKLDVIRKWLYSKVRERSQGRRFQKFR